jgi:alpha-L-fucosidase 2
MIVPDVTDSPGVVTVLDLEDTTMLITAALMTLITSTPTLDPSTDLLWYNRPAATWTEALALGNGRLGAMVFGGLQSDRIALNESTVWTGGPYDPKGDGVGANALPEIQRLVFAGKGPEAEALFEKEMMSKTGEMAAYQPLGDLLLTFPDHAFATHYRRNLDLTTAISRVSYESKGVHYRREVICSYPDQVIALHLTADKPGALNFSATLDGRTNVKEPNDATYRISSQAPGTIILRGNTASYGGGHGLVYEARLRVVTEGGSARIDFDREHDCLVIQGANSATLYVVAGTNFKSWKELGADPTEANKKRLEHVIAKGYSGILADHIADYRTFYERTHLDLGHTPESLRPTDERFAAFQAGHDPALPALLFHFGRYLLISSSREGSQPPNLQGLWNADMEPAWGGKLTTNINQEMNYWPVDSANLSELASPYLVSRQNFLNPAREQRKGTGTRVDGCLVTTPTCGGRPIPSMALIGRPGTAEQPGWAPCCGTITGSPEIQLG